MNENTFRQPSITLQKWMKIVTHFLCLCIIFILPEVIMSKSGPPEMIHWRGYVKSVVFVAVFYINYYYVIDRCIGKPYWVLRLAGWNFIIMLVAVGIVQVVLHGHSPHAPLFSPLHKLSFLMRDCVMVVLTASLSMAVKLSDYLMKLNNQRKELVAAQHKEELESLKKQLNPHFLFNTLNTIYALIAINPDKAQKAVHELSGLLRYVLYENTPTVSLADELRFIDNYVRLMQLRLGDRVPVSLTLDAGMGEARQIAPLLFISPVENAFKYGNTGSREDKIDIDIHYSDGVVVCRISNHFIPVKDKSHDGIGHANLRRRLELIYGSNASLKTEICGDSYIVEMIIRIDL